MPRAIKTKLYCHQRNKKIKVCDKFGIKATDLTREALMMDNMSNITIWVHAITKKMPVLERLGIF